MFFFLAVLSMLGYAIQGTFLVPYARKMDGLSLAVYRNLSLGLSMLPLLFFAKGNIITELVNVAHLLVPAGIFGALALWSGFFAQRSLPVGVYGALSNVRILFIILWSLLFIHETISPEQFLRVAVLLVGVIFVSLQKNHFPHLDGKVFRGTLYSFTAALCGSITVFLSGFAAREADPFVVGYFWEMLIGLLAVIIVSIRLFATHQKIHPISLREFWKITGISSTTLIGTGAFMLAVNYGPIGIVGAIGSASIIFSTFFSHFAYHEKLKWQHWLGIIVVVLAIVGLELARSA